MPWSSDGYDKENYSKLMKKFGIRGIPCLVILNEDGETAATTKGRGDVDNGPFMALE